MNIKLGLGAALLGMSMLVGGAASAATVTQLIHFDDVKNGAKDYTTADENFFFDPVNPQSGHCAISTNGGNGSCLHEVKQGTVTTMTRLTPLDASLPKIFSLDSFYFNLQGKGGNAVNSITAKSNVGPGVTFQLGQSYASGIYDYLTGSLYTGVLDKQIGYIADLRANTNFDNILNVKFSASETANVRVDCVVATFDGTTTEPLSGFKNKCAIGNGGGGTVVPLPGGMPLMLAGLGAIAFLARRKARKA